MAAITLFSPEELAERNKPKRQQKREARERIVESFCAMLRDAGPGYGGEVMLEEGEEKRHYRGYLKEAAARSNLKLKFRPIKDPQRISFLVDEPTKRRRGRPKGSRNATSGKADSNRGPDRV